MADSVFYKVSITKSVGKRGVNLAGDVQKIADLFNHIPATEGAPDTDLVNPSQDKLNEAILEFQEFQPGLIGDGRIDPGGQTLRRMNEKAKAIDPPGGNGAANGAAGGALQWDLAVGTEAFYQAALPWQRMLMNHSQLTLQNAGCLLTCIATGFAWHKVRVPADSVDEVQGILTDKGLGNYGADGVVTPARLEAWMTANDSQGYVDSFSATLDAGQVGRITSDKNLIFWGQHSVKRNGFLAMPSAAKLRTWLAAKHVLIAHLDSSVYDGDHWVVLTGHNGGSYFTCWDVGYGPGNPEHTAGLEHGQFNLLNHYGPT